MSTKTDERFARPGRKDAWGPLASTAIHAYEAYKERRSQERTKSEAVDHVKVAPVLVADVRAFFGIDVDPEAVRVLRRGRYLIAKARCECFEFELTVTELATIGGEIRDELQAAWRCEDCGDHGPFGLCMSLEALGEKANDYRRHNCRPGW